MVGSKGMLHSPNDYGERWDLLPAARFKDYKGPPPTIPRSPGHHKEWVIACKGGPAAMSNFTDYAGPLTEMLLLGNVAMRAGRKIDWDSASLSVTNYPEANKFLRREYRSGWSL